MINLSSVGANVSTSSQVSPTPRKTTLTQEDFMNLFTTQMKFQNPLEPLDNYQMATQMAQFNTVDALSKMNETLDRLISQQATASNLQASGLIGKKVMVKGNCLTLQEGKVEEGFYQLSRPGRAVIRIYDANGHLIQEMDAGNRGTSQQAIGWDGRGTWGSALPDGVYTFQVLATDEQGQAIPVTPYRVGTISGLSFDQGTPRFHLGSEKIVFSDILSIVA